jgi:hypothetical protein
MSSNQATGTRSNINRLGRVERRNRHVGRVQHGKFEAAGRQPAAFPQVNDVQASG